MTAGRQDSGGPPARAALGWWALPIPLALTIPWVLLLLPLKLPVDAFSVPAALIAAALLTLVMWAVRRKRLPVRWVILPLLCWVYECLPVTLPGPFDEALALGGSGMAVVWAWAKAAYLPGGEGAGKTPEKERMPHGTRQP